MGLAARHKTFLDEYGVFKPFILQMSLTGVFSLSQNEAVGKLLKFASLSYCLSRILLGGAYTVASILSYILSPEGDTVLYTQVTCYATVNLINISGLIYLSIINGGFKRFFHCIFDCLEFKALGNRCKEAFIKIQMWYLTLTLIIAGYKVYTFCIDEKGHYDLITQFYPYMKPNTEFSMIFTIIFSIIFPVGDIMSDLIYATMCVAVAKIFVHFNEEFKDFILSMKDNRKDQKLSMEYFRGRHEKICTHITRLNQLFAVHLGFNIFSFIAMICGISYVVLFKGLTDYWVFCVVFTLRLSGLIIASGYLSAQVYYQKYYKLFDHSKSGSSQILSSYHGIRYNNNTKNPA